VCFVLKYLIIKTQEGDVKMIYPVGVEQQLNRMKHLSYEVFCAMEDEQKFNLLLSAYMCIEKLSKGV